MSDKGESVYAAIGNRSGKIANVTWEWSGSQRYYLIAIPNKWSFGRVSWCNPGSDFRGYSFGWETFRVTSSASLHSIERNPAIYDNLGLSDSQLRRVRFRRSHETVHERLDVSPWLIVAAFGAYPAIALVRTVRRRRTRNQPGLCECGYDLTGNESGACPECGTVIAGSVIASLPPPHA